jgi:hypothetical protein
MSVARVAHAEPYKPAAACKLMQVCFLHPQDNEVLLLAVPAGVFDWLQQQGRVASLIRQVSNPMAGCDTTLLLYRIHSPSCCCCRCCCSCRCVRLAAAARPRGQSDLPSQ